MPMLPRCCILLAFIVSGTALSKPIEPDVHARCLRVEAGMGYREAMAIMGREPDSTLSGHSAAGPGGDPPAGSYAIDFWNDASTESQRRTSALYHRGGIIENTDCARPATPSHGAQAPAQDN